MTESPTVIYAREQELTPAEFRQILIESGFGPYRRLTTNHVSPRC